MWLNKDDFASTSGVNDGFFFWDTVVGLFYEFSPKIAFRGELGSQGPKAGISAFF